MPSFGKRSLDNLATCHPDLQRLFNEVIKTYDCTILEGHRGKEDQHKYFLSGASKLDWPNGNHNAMPSNAVDVAPYPILWDSPDKNVRTKYAYKIYHFCGYVKAVAERLGIAVRFGCDWDGDLDFADQNFDDSVHIELAKH